MIACNDLRRRYREGRLLPFIGAGVSKSLHWHDRDGNRATGPSWRELVDTAAQKLGFDDPDLLRVRGSDLQILEYFRLKKHGHAALTNWLTAKMNPSDDELRESSIHRELARLTRCKLYYTTNYDHFLERTFELHGRPARAVGNRPAKGVW